MRQRITFLHRPEDAIDPESIIVTGDSLSLSGLKAAREDRITFGFEELSDDISLLLRQAHELHIRYVNRISYESISPLLSRASAGLHVYYTPQRDSSNLNLLCPMLHKIFSPVSQNLCQSPEKSFTSLPTQRFHHSTAYEYYLPHTHYSKHALVDYILQTCPASNKSCLNRVETLRDAEYIDLDFDAISHALTLTAFWPSQTWTLSISRTSSRDRLEVGILSNEKPLELEELNLGGFLTVVGDDVKPSPTLFAFPARHHHSSSSFSATFLKPTGLHPSLQLQIGSAAPPSDAQTCSLHAHLTLPRVLFADKYQLSDALFLASKNLSQIRHITSPVDLEAPEYTMSLWGSSLLLELAPPAPALNFQDRPWTAEIPLHLRYLPPAPGGYRNVSVPWPVLFWACTAEEGSKFAGNPFDRVNLGYDGLFGPRTMFYHLEPAGAGNGDGEGGMAASGRGRELVGTDGYSVIDVPVLKLEGAEWVELGTAVVVLLGFGWVMWKLSLVLRKTGYGRDVEDEMESKKVQ